MTTFRKIKSHDKINHTSVLTRRLRTTKAKQLAWLRCWDKRLFDLDIFDFCVTAPCFQQVKNQMFGGGDQKRSSHWPQGCAFMNGTGPTEWPHTDEQTCDWCASVCSKYFYRSDHLGFMSESPAVSSTRPPAERHKPRLQRRLQRFTLTAASAAPPQLPVHVTSCPRHFLSGQIIISQSCVVRPVFVQNTKSEFVCISCQIFTGLTETSPTIPRCWLHHHFVLTVVCVEVKFYSHDQTKVFVQRSSQGCKYSVSTVTWRKMKERL